MRTLGLDPSLRSYGWAVYDSDAEPRFRRVESGHEGTLSSVVPVARFVHFRSMVSNLLKRFEVDAVGIESPAYGAGPFQSIHFGLMMFSLEPIFELRKDCVLFDPTTLKHLVSKSGSGKTEMQRFVQIDTMDPAVIDNNEADAYCVAREACRFTLTKEGLIPEDDLSPNERSVFLERKRRVKSSSSGVRLKRTAHAFRENSRFFNFSKIPPGDVNLPQKSMIRASLLEWLEKKESGKEGP